MKALIFAAGLGTRLRPITDNIPKALVPVAGVPMLERVVRKLQQAGFDEFVINAHHHAGKIEEFVRSRGSFGAEVRLSVEEGEPLETGGGIRKAAPLLGQGPFLAHNADILCKLDVRDFISKHRPGSLATLLVQKAEADRQLLFDDDMRLAGWMNQRTGEVKSPLPDFNPDKYVKYSFCGIHIISDAVFPLMEEWPEKFGIIDFYLAVAADYPIYGVAGENLELIDIGSPEKLELANRVYSSSI